MGFKDKFNKALFTVGDALTKENHAAARSQAHPLLLRIGDKALILLESGGLTVNDFLKLANRDYDTIKAFIDQPSDHIPGTLMQKNEMRDIAREALIIVVRDEI